jgi:VWFA-related protein
MPKMRRNVSTVILILLALALDFQATSPASPRSGQDQEVLKHEVTVTLKLVQVHVVDSRGEPVTDLTKDDFILTDNGKIQTITDFEKHILFTPGEKGEPAGQEEASSGTDFNRKFFLFFDLAFNSARGIENAKQAALAFLDQQLLPTDEVGVLSYSVNKFLTMHEILTTDHNKVKEAVKGIGREGILGRAEDVEQGYWGTIEEMLRPENADMSETERLEQRSAFNSIRMDRLLSKQQVLIFIRVLKELAQALSRIPGHKHILFLSTGIPASIFEGDTSKKTAGLRDFIFQDAFADVKLSDQLEEMIRLMAASDSSVSPLYAEGTNSGSSPEFGFRDRQQLGKTTLQRIAAGTGGKYFGNIQNIKPILREIQNASSSFYVLGYTIGTSWDGKFHELSVKTRRKGCTVQAQTGYFNPKPFRQLTAMERKMDFLELALEEKSHFLAPLDLSLKAMPLTVEGLGALLTMAKIPAAAVQYLAGKQVEIANIIFDEKNDLRHIKSWRVDFTTLPIKDVFFYTLSSLPAGRYKSRLVLRNTETGTSAVSSAQAAVEAADGSGLLLSRPLLLIPEKKAIYLKGARLPGEDKGQKMIDLPDLYPCDFNVWAPIIDEMERGTAGLTAVVRGHVPGIQNPELKITPRLMYEATGEILPIPFSVSQKSPENGVQVFFVSFPSEQLGPGKYILHIDAQETETGVESQIRTTFSIK